MSAAKADIPAERAQEIVELAEAVADEYCPIGKTEPELIVQRKEIRLIYDHYADAFDGMIEHQAGRFYIHCNLDRENLPRSPRGRFTLSHELGHFFIDEHRNGLASGRVRPHPSFADKPSGDLRVEREADLFASHLLIPPSRFLAALPRARKGLSGIVDLATKFNVSLTCAAIRYVTHEVEPSVLIKWPFAGRGWKWPSKEFRARNYGKIVSDMRQLPTDSATSICVSSGQRSTGVIGGKIAARTWFPSMPATAHLILREEAITLGRYGVLTLLRFATGSEAKQIL